MKKSIFFKPECNINSSEIYPNKITNHNSKKKIKNFKKKKTLKSAKMADDLDLVNRDPNNMNNYIQVSFDDVLAEPEGAHSADW